MISTVLYLNSNAKKLKEGLKKKKMYFPVLLPRIAPLPGSVNKQDSNINIILRFELMNVKPSGLDNISMHQIKYPLVFLIR